MRKNITLIILMVVPWLVQAQPTDWSYSIGFLSQSFFYPSKYTLQGPIHPGVIAGVEINLKDKPRVDRLLTAEVGFYHHDYFQNGAFVIGGYQFNTNPVGDLYVWGQPQLGYLHTFSPTGEWELQSGSYEKVRSGHPAAIAGLALGVDYQLIPTYQTKISLSYRAMVEGPFALNYGVPVVPHTFITLGLKSKLFAQ